MNRAAASLGSGSGACGVSLTARAAPSGAPLRLASRPATLYGLPITVTGVLAIGRDIGAGYANDAIVEKAKIVK